MKQEAERSIVLCLLVMVGIIYGPQQASGNIGTGDTNLQADSASPASDVDDVIEILPSHHVYYLQHSFEQQRRNDRSRLRTFQNVLDRVEQMKIIKKRNPGDRIIMYGEDDRTMIPFWRLRQFPYINVVWLSSGCTGTLLTPSFVLTAAHCVHDGDAFKENVKKLKITIPNNIGKRIYHASEIVVPYGWIRNERGRLAETYRVAYDYALIKLSISVYGRHEFMPLHIPTRKSFFHEKLYFLGYPFYADILYRSECVSDTHFLFFHNNILLNKCDSTTRNSGASIYIENARRGEYKIIGVLSGSKATKSNNHVIRFTTFSLLTESKLRDICTIISPEGEEFGVCPTYYQGNRFPQFIYYG